MKVLIGIIFCLDLSLTIFIRLCACNYILYRRYKEYTYDFMMPHVIPDTTNTHLCMKISIRDNFYLVGFEPKASSDYIHQMILYGCTQPGSNDTIWNCAGRPIFMTSTEYDHGDPCQNGSQIIYSWANDAKGYHLPKEVGFHIGTDSPIQYLVLQVHYLQRYKERKLMTVDNSGVILKYTKKRLPHLAGVLVIGTKGVIPAKSIEHLEATCTIDEENIIHPFAYRIHTHEHGRVVSCYVVREGQSGDYWTTLAKNSPARPQAFYPVKDFAPIRKGDILASRCTMNNTNNQDIRIGKYESSESCNFHLMYWVDGSPLRKKYCISPGPPAYYWSQALQNFRNIPDVLASVL